MTDGLGYQDERSHTAARAWRRLQPGGEPPRAIEALGATAQSSVYRLHGMGSTGTSIVAKRSYSSSIRVERVVYEEILPTLSLSALRCYGSVEDEDGRFVAEHVQAKCASKYEAAPGNDRPGATTSSQQNSQM